MPDPYSPMPRRRFLRRTLGLAGAAVTVGLVGVATDAVPAMGARAGGPRLARMRRSPQYRDGRFRNPLPVRTEVGADGLREWVRNSAIRTPTSAVPFVPVSREEAARPPTTRGAALRWLGHATLLIEVGGRRLLTDPLFNDRAGPGRLVGPARFFPPPLALADLPEIDAILLTHDHYDHLSAATLRILAGRVPRFLAPLGVGAHLERWGVAPERITELDWWESTDIGGVAVTATPARHFSGRGIHDRDATLWCGYAVASTDARLWLSGDGGYGPHFREIGTRLGPFDLALVEIGAYDRRWRDVHLGPEQAVQAVQDVGAAAMLPIHWATFNLAFHGWTEPGERVLVAAEGAGVPLSLPLAGARVELGALAPAERWWPENPWKTAEEEPVVSSGL